MNWNGKVHPAAAVFPMLAEDELAELALDIVEHGLRDPIVLLPDGTLLEGRNRQAACDRSGTWPTYTVYEGNDPVAFVLSKNVHRRHMTTGQRAMAVAITLAGDGKRDNGRWKRGTVGAIGDVSDSAWRRSLSDAGQVLDHAPDLGPLVVAGAMTLAEAQREAEDRAKAADDDSERLARLTADAPDLAAQVREETLTLGEAVAAYRERERKAAEQRRDAVALLTRIVDLTAPPDPDPAYVDAWADRIGDAAVDLGRVDLTISILSRLADRIRAR